MKETEKKRIFFSFSDSHGYSARIRLWYSLVADKDIKKPNSHTNKLHWLTIIFWVWNAVSVSEVATVVSQERIHREMIM